MLSRLVPAGAGAGALRSASKYGSSSVAAGAAPTGAISAFAAGAARAVVANRIPAAAVRRRNMWGVLLLGRRPVRRDNGDSRRADPAVPHPRGVESPHPPAGVPSRHGTGD